MDRSGGISWRRTLKRNKFQFASFVLSQRYNCAFQSSAMLSCVASYVLPDVSKEHVTIVIGLKALEPLNYVGNHAISDATSYHRRPESYIISDPHNYCNSIG
jgi:hypothetical protein